jgi:predicted DNA-binding protein (UPF0251 family)
MHDCQKFREDWVSECGVRKETGCDECRLFCEDTSAILSALRSSNPVPDASAAYWTWFENRLRVRLAEESAAAHLRAVRYRWIAAYATAASVAIALTWGSLHIPSPADRNSLAEVVLETDHIEGLDRNVVDFLAQSELLVRDFTKIDPSHKEEIAVARERASRSLASLNKQKSAAAAFDPVRITLDEYESVLRDFKNLDSPEDIAEIQMRIRRNGLIANLKAYQPRVVPVSLR